MKKYISEMIFTFIFVLVVLGVTDDKKGTPVMCGLAIGLTLVLVHIVCIPITGTSVNPARSIGPALFEGGKALTQLWLEKPRDFDPFGHAGFAHLWLQYD